jgi:polyhydroxyalkanoic acid synthase PhaR subunit
MSDRASSNPDPFAAWRDWLGQSERQWNSFLNEAMATDQYGQAMGQMMDMFLNAQKGMSDVMGRAFTGLNLPTRTDVLSLGNRLTDIEERLSAIEGALKGRAGPEPTPPPAAAEIRKPARTKKPTV